MNVRVPLLATLLASLASAQNPDSPRPAELRPATQPRDAAAAAATLRTHYFAQDFEAGAAAAEQLVARFPGSAEVRAWQIVNLARVTGKEAVALAMADSNALWRDAASPWRSFARAFAWHNQRDGSARAVENAAAFRRTNPWTRDAVWLHGYTLHGAAKYAHAIALIDSALPRVRPADRGTLLVIKANALSSQSNVGEPDTAMRRRAADTFAEARRADPDNLNAHYLAAANLSRGPTDTVALRLMERAASMTPALNVHQRYWSTVRNRRDLTPAVKDSLIAIDVERLIALRPNASGVLRAGYQAYVEMKRFDKSAPLLAKLRAEHGASSDVEWIDYMALMELRDSIFKKEFADTAAAGARSRAALAEMLARPVHHIDGIYGTLLLLQYHETIEHDSTISADSLRRFGETLAKYNTANPHRTHLDLPLLVAEKKGDFRWAERMVLAGDSMRRTQTERMKAQIVRSDGVGGYADRLDYLEATKHAALGWIYTHEGRFAAADSQLAKALELQRRDPRIHYHLGRLAEARGKPMDAQAAYARGFPLEQGFTGFRNRDALQRIYRSNNGSLDGFDAFVEKLKAEDRERRRTKIAGDRMTTGSQLASFSLERYGANRASFSSDSLKGKVAVINFWGVWCGPCVKEIPDIQKFHETLKGDTGVVFLTVDYNDTPETLHEFMVKQKLTFPVLLDADRFASDRARVSAYPTTFFIGRDGTIAWRHTGASDVVLEEFLWRVEMLKAERPRQP